MPLLSGVADPGSDEPLGLVRRSGAVMEARLAPAASLRVLPLVARCVARVVAPLGVALGRVWWSVLRAGLGALPR